MKNTIKAFSLIFFTVVLFAGCTSAPSSMWQNDLPAVSTVHSFPKDAMFIFTGSDWDERSAVAIKKLLNQEFTKKFSQDFLLYHIDVVRNNELMAPEKLTQNYIYYSEYGVTNLPFIVLETPDGDAYASEDFATNCEDLNSFSALVNQLLENRDTVIQARKKIASSEGPEKTQAIDDFFKVIHNADSARYESLRTLALESDPENKTGLKAKYLLLEADRKSSQFAIAKKFRDASKEFVEVAQMPELTTLEKQTAYYSAAYFLAMSQDVKKAEVEDLLKKALEIEPNSQIAPNIERALESINSNYGNTY